MNLDQRLKEFKQFEKDDETFWAKVIGEEDPEMPAGVRTGDTRLSASETPVVISGEIIESVWEEDFTSIERNGEHRGVIALEVTAGRTSRRPR